MRFLLLLQFALLLALPAQAGDEAPADTLKRFYSWVLDHPTSALPSAKERAQLSCVLAPQLGQLLEAAAAMEAQCIKVAEAGEKPNVLEGDLFVGTYEGASDVAYGKMARRGGAVVADINLVYIDARFPKADRFRAYIWKNQVELRQFGARWLIQNVRFEKNESLVSVLRQYIADGARSCQSPAPQAAKGL